MNFCTPLWRSVIALENDWLAEGFGVTGCYERICRYKQRLSYDVVTVKASLQGKFVLCTFSY